MHIHIFDASAYRDLVSVNVECIRGGFACWRAACSSFSLPSTCFSSFSVTRNLTYTHTSLSLSISLSLCLSFSIVDAWACRGLGEAPSTGIRPHITGVPRSTPSTGIRPHITGVPRSTGIRGGFACWRAVCSSFSLPSTWSRLRGLEFGIRGFGSRVSGFGFQFAGFGIRVSESGFRDPNFGPIEREIDRYMYIYIYYIYIQI